jgi:amidophosphoribosyltransferase
VFDGIYVTGDVNAEYLEQLELIRNDAAKEARDEASRSILEIHNTA